jgi:hypothetical protein
VKGLRHTVKRLWQAKWKFTVMLWVTWWGLLFLYHLCFKIPSEIRLEAKSNSGARLELPLPPSPPPYGYKPPLSRPSPRGPGLETLSPLAPVDITYFVTPPAFDSRSDRHTLRVNFAIHGEMHRPGFMLYSDARIDEADIGTRGVSVGGDATSPPVKFDSTHVRMLGITFPDPVTEQDGLSIHVTTLDQPRCIMVAKLATSGNSEESAKISRAAGSALDDCSTLLHNLAGYFSGPR